MQLGVNPLGIYTAIILAPLGESSVRTDCKKVTLTKEVSKQTVHNTGQSGPMFCFWRIEGEFLHEFSLVSPSPVGEEQHS